MSTWAIGSVDLLVPFEAEARRVGARRGLEQALRSAVRSGRLAAGNRLPSSRALAADLGLARNTVADAFTQLVAEGYLEARTGAGTYVAATRGTVARADPAARSTRALGTVAHDLRSGSPDVSLFPRSVWLAATRRVLGAVPHAALGYGDPRGQRELRETLAGYLARVRGVSADPDQLVVCAGHSQAVSLVSRALHAGGARAAAIEAPGLPYLPTLVGRTGLRVVPLDVDRDGARTDRLGDLDVGAVLLTPAHQFPTGALLSPARRAAALDWSRASGGLMVEDDYDGEFRFDRRPVGALQGLAPEHTVYVGTASKSLAPGLRLAWMVVPAAHLDAVVEEKRYSDTQSPVIEALVLADLIRSGAYDRQVRRARLVYRRRREALVAALQERAPAVTPMGMPAGLQVVLRLPAGTDEADLLRRAAERELGLDGLAGYGSDAASATHGPALVVGYGTPTGRSWAAALDALCELLAEL